MSPDVAQHPTGNQWIGFWNLTVAPIRWYTRIVLLDKRSSFTPLPGLPIIVVENAPLSKAMGFRLVFLQQDRDATTCRQRMLVEGWPNQSWSKLFSSLDHSGLPGTKSNRMHSLYRCNSRPQFRLEHRLLEGLLIWPSVWVVPTRG